MNKEKRKTLLPLCLFFLFEQGAYSPKLHQEKKKIEKLILDTYDKIKDLIDHESYVIDFYVKEDGTVLVVELNPFHIGKDSFLFTFFFFLPRPFCLFTFLFFSVFFFLRSFLFSFSLLKKMVKYWCLFFLLSCFFFPRSFSIFLRPLFSFPLSFYVKEDDTVLVVELNPFHIGMKKRKDLRKGKTKRSRRRIEEQRK